MSGLELLAKPVLESVVQKAVGDISVNAANDISHHIVSETASSVEQRELSLSIEDIGHSDKFRIGELDSPELQNKEICQTRELNASCDLRNKIESQYSWNDKMLSSESGERVYSVEAGKDSYLLNGELPENSKFIIANPGGENTITVTTDEFGRHKTIDIDSIQRTDGTRDIYQQQRCCELKDGFRGKDDAGHILAREFGGPPEQFNLLPQDSYVNRFGEQRNMEKSWEKLLDNGGTVKDIHIDVNYAEGSDSFRPTGYEVSCKENDIPVYRYIDNTPRNDTFRPQINNVETQNHDDYTIDNYTEEEHWYDSCTPDELSCEDGDNDHWNGDIG